MKKRRNNLKQVRLEQDLTLKNCRSIASANQIEIMDAKEDNSLIVSSQIRHPGKIKRGRNMCEDLVIRILMRLPAKSLMRFKCVSKQWSSLISCPYFSNLFLTITQQPRMYTCLVDDDGQRQLLSISSNKTCFVVDQELSIPGIGGFYLNGVYGLMCFTVRNKARIYNPATKQYLTLPKIKPNIIAKQGQSKDTRYYIGHDPANDQYKILCTIGISSQWLRKVKSEHWVLVLEAGASWKKIANHHHHAPFSLGRFISAGSLVYYMAWLGIYTCVVVSFDIGSQEFTTIPVPRGLGNVPLLATMLKAELIEYGGKIAIFNHSYLEAHGKADLWVLEDVGKQEWSNKSLVLQPCQRHLAPGVELIVRGTTPDGEVILAPLEMRSPFLYILCYDNQSNDLRKIEIKGVPHRWFDKECYFDLRFMDKECFWSSIVTLD